jgi:ABC-type amino acid transport substrate-binding protein
MFKIEDDKILWEGRVVATFVDGLSATLRDNVESALECYEKDSVSRKDYEAALRDVENDYSDCVSGDDFAALEERYEELKNKLDKLTASN